jgi:hypothetical protein
MDACSTIVTGICFAGINYAGAKLSCVLSRADTGIDVYTINTLSSLLTMVANTIINVLFTLHSLESTMAMTVKSTWLINAAASIMAWI